MTEIAVPWRVFVGGCAAAAIGVTVFAGGTASADPVAPTPPPAPAGAVQTPQNFVAAPGGAAGRRFVPTPPSANPFAPPSLAVAPGAAAVAPTPPAANPFAPPTLAAAPAAAGAPAPAQPAPTPAASGTLRDYFQSKGVKLEAQKPQGFKALDITLPVPARWTQVPDPNVPDAFAVIADRQGASVYTSNAQVVVYKLVGNFDPREAITHGYVDSQKLLAWQPTNASMADFAGFPSSVVEGTYREGDMTLNTSRRHVIASSGHDKYLVSLSVTTDRAVAVSDAPATNAIINGFRVTAPGAPAAPAPSTAPVGLPGQTPAAAPAPVRAPAVIPAQPPAAAAALPAPAAAPAPAAVPSQLQAAQPAPNLLALVPGLPPLPNFTSITGR